jgi:tetratricopeptide (TPR) repeat protein
MGFPAMKSASLTILLLLLQVSVLDKAAAQGGPTIGGLIIAGSTPLPQREQIATGYRALTIEKNYPRAIASFQALLTQIREPVTRKTALDFLNASLYAGGRHRDALDLICQEHRGSPDIPLLFDVHAHIRKLSLNEGYAAAAQLARQLRHVCNMPVFSAVWTGIPLVKMEYLRARTHVLDEKYILRDKDKIILSNVIAAEPDDAFVEFARYFLHDFANVKHPYLASLQKLPAEDSHPDRHGIKFADLDAVPAPSRERILEDLRALMAKPYFELAAGSVFLQLHLQGRIRDEIAIFAALDETQQRRLATTAVSGVRRILNDAGYIEEMIQSAPEPSRWRLAHLIASPRCANLDHCADLLKWFPQSWLVDRRTSEFILNAWEGARADDEPMLEAPIQAVARLSKLASQSRPGMLRAELDKSTTTLELLKPVARKDLKKVLAILLDRKCASVTDCEMFFGYVTSSEIAKDVLERFALQLLAERSLADAVVIVNRLPMQLRDRILGAPDGLGPRAQQLGHIYKLVQQGDADGLLKIAITLRGRKLGEGRPRAAKSILDHLAQQYPRTTAGEKAQFLLFTTAAYRIGERDDAVKHLKSFIERYPNSDLIDDAYTELGVIEYRWNGNFDAAKRLLERVYRDYPRRNAADNALYHLAIMSLERRDYISAARYFTLSATVYGKNRLGQLAATVLNPTKQAAAATADRKFLQGLILLLYDPIEYRDGIAVDKVEPSAIETPVAVEAGDRLVSFDGVAPKSVRDFYGALAKRNYNDKVPVLFKRRLPSGETIEIAGLARVIAAQMFDVHWVEVDDVLNVRDRPMANAIKVGELPPTATCIRVTRRSPVADGRHPWFEIDYRAADNRRIAGWVNSTFLKKSSVCFN